MSDARHEDGTNLIRDGARHHRESWQAEDQRLFPRHLSGCNCSGETRSRWMWRRSSWLCSNRGSASRGSWRAIEVSAEPCTRQRHHARISGLGASGNHFGNMLRRCLECETKGWMNLKVTTNSWHMVYSVSAVCAESIVGLGTGTPAAFNSSRSWIRNLASRLASTKIPPRRL